MFCSCCLDEPTMADAEGSSRAMEGIEDFVADLPLLVSYNKGTPKNKREKYEYIIVQRT